MGLIAPDFFQSVHQVVSVDGDFSLALSGEDFLGDRGEVVVHGLYAQAVLEGGEANGVVLALGHDQGAFEGLDEVFTGSPDVPLGRLGGDGVPVAGIAGSGEVEAHTGGGAFDDQGVTLPRPVEGKGFAAVEDSKCPCVKLSTCLPPFAST